MAATAITEGSAGDMDARIAALERRRANDFHITGHSVLGRLYATEAVHRLLPDRVALTIAAGLGRLRWYWPSTRRKAIARVSLTVKGTPREAEVRSIARRELSIQWIGAECDWRRRMLARAPIKGVERLEAALASSRPVLITGAHLGGGTVSVLRAHGFSFYSATGRWFDPDAPLERRGYSAYKIRALRRWGEKNGARYVIMGGSFDLLRALLERGETCVVFCDTPGRMRTRMAGKTARLASGPAMLAHQTGAIVVPTTCLLDTRGPHVEILDPIDPHTMSGPQEIVDRLASIYGELMVRHPEQVEPLGFMREVFAEDGADYPSDLWWFPSLRTRARNKTTNALRRRLHGGD